MSDLILHHYDGSPFSEKIRLILGFKGLAWKSVKVPVMLPKPDVVALTGGYRRTPFLQMGADIYCDTALMSRVIDTLAPQPPLYPVAATGAQHILAQWADSTLFWTAIPYTMQLSTIIHRPGPGSPYANSPKRRNQASMLMVITVLIPKRFRKNGMARMKSVSEICEIDMMIAG
jgi:glutathione S-transferase